MKKLKHGKSMLCLTVATLFSSNIALAQIEEIVVTATKHPGCAYFHLGLFGRLPGAI